MTDSAFDRWSYSDCFAGVNADDVFGAALVGCGVLGAVWAAANHAKPDEVAVDRVRVHRVVFEFPHLGGAELGRRVKTPVAERFPFRTWVSSPSSIRIPIVMCWVSLVACSLYPGCVGSDRLRGCALSSSRRR
jgi:hypothetical protein